MARVNWPTVVDGGPNGVRSASRRASCFSARFSASSTRFTRSAQSGVFAPSLRYSGRSARRCACTACRSPGLSKSSSCKTSQSSKQGSERAIPTPLRLHRSTASLKRGCSSRSKTAQTWSPFSKEFSTFLRVLPSPRDRAHSAAKPASVYGTPAAPVISTLIRVLEYARLSAEK